MDGDFAADFPSSPVLEDSDVESDAITSTDETAMLSTPSQQQLDDMEAVLDETPTQPAQSQMLPPPRPASDQSQVPTTSPSATVHMLTQEPNQPRFDREDAEQHVLTTSNHGDSTNENLASESNDITEQEIPEDDLSPFNWADLEHRYHDRVQELDVAQHQIVEEFRSLSDYFAVWADVGSRHEIERSFKRLKTQMTFVQQQETQLEQRRQHYIKVIDAFRNALDLLAN